ncbi:hypothetical protein FACS18948_3100 [Clostridia bacterium]|nr:hypothetical protein FACS18948_3100 [Clostridia bacterium]
MDEFLEVKDIMRILKIGRTKALEVMHGFIQSGAGIQVGRVYRVRREVFYAWLSQLDGFGLRKKPLKCLVGGKASAVGGA